MDKQVEERVEEIRTASNVKMGKPETNKQYIARLLRLYDAQAKILDDQARRLDRSLFLLAAVTKYAEAADTVLCVLGEADSVGLKAAWTNWRQAEAEEGNFGGDGRGQP